MVLRVRKVGDLTIIDLEGKFYADRKSDILPTVQRLLDAGERKIVLNMANVSRTDDDPGGEVMAAFARVHHQGGKLVMCGFRLNFPPFDVPLGPSLSRVHDSEADAIASL